MGTGTRTRRNLDAYEARRLKGVELFERGYGASEVAVRTGVSRQAVSQWLQLWRRGGKPALARVKHKGRPPRLNPRQCERLSGMLRQGPAAHGYPDDLWNGRRVARLIQDAFGVTFHPKCIPRFLRALGWTCRKPAESSGERDAAATARWTAREEPASKRKPPATGQGAVHR